MEIKKFTHLSLCFVFFYFFFVDNKAQLTRITYPDYLVYKEIFFSEWSKWTSCSSSCSTSRQKICKDLSSSNSRNCLVKVIKEIKSCDCYDNKSINLATLKVLPQTCGKRLLDNNVRHKIIGGHATKVNEWPWMVNLGSIINKEVFLNCGATLLSNRWIITAAHCMKPYISPNYKPGILTKVEEKTKFINIGNYHKSLVDNGEYNAYISHIIVHPLFYSDYTKAIYDFALLKLENPIKNINTKFPCISNDTNFQFPLHSLCYAVGWATEDNRNSLFDDRLQEIQIPLASYQTCREEYMNIYINYSLHICAGSKKKDTCEGDSGSGLYCLDPKSKKWFLYGIVSFGTNLGCGNSIGVYARISAAIDWITDVISLF